MSKTKVFVITADTEYDLVRLMNESDKNFFASQPIQKIDGKWVCFIYYNGDEK